MSLPRIPSPGGDVVIPAVAQKTFPDKALMGIRMRRVSKKVVQCDVGYQAYNYDTEEMSDDDSTLERFTIPNLLAAASVCPPLKSTLNDLINVLTLKYKQAKLRERIGATEEGAQYNTLVSILNDLEVNDLQLTEREPIPPPYVEVIAWAKPPQE